MNPRRCQSSCLHHKSTGEGINYWTPEQYVSTRGPRQRWTIFPFALHRVLVLCVPPSGSLWLGVSLPLTVQLTGWLRGYIQRSGLGTTLLLLLLCFVLTLFMIWKPLGVSGRLHYAAGEVMSRWEGQRGALIFCLWFRSSSKGETNTDPTLPTLAHETSH